MKLILLSISTIVFLSYISFIWIRYGVQKSISDSFYRIKDDHIKILGLKIRTKEFFTLFIAFFAYPLAVLAANVWLTPAAFIVLGIGIARDFKDTKLLKWIHYCCAYIGIGIAIIGLGAHYDMWWLTITFVILSFMLMIIKVPNKIWWIECVAIATVLIGLGIAA